MKKIFIIVLSIVGVLSFVITANGAISGGSGGGIGAPNYWKLTGTVLSPINPLWSVTGTAGALFSGNTTDMATTTVITAGDILIRNSSNKWTNFPIGTNGYVLTASSSAPLKVDWIASTGGSSSSATTTINGVDGPIFNLTGTTNRLTVSTSSTSTITLNVPDSAQLNIAKLLNLTSNGFVKTSSGDGTLSVDTSTYLTANQTITLSGDVTGSGTTAITTSYGNIVPILKGGIATSTTPGVDKILIGNGTNYDLKTLTAGTNITITTSTSAITIGSTGGGSSFWTTINNTPTRTSSSTLTVSGGGDVSTLLSRGMVMKWTESSTAKYGMIASSTYSNPTTTIEFMGDQMASIDSSSLKYSLEKARIATLAVAGTLGATTTDIAGRFNVPFPMKIYGADIYLGTAGNGTMIVDINKNGTSIFATKPQITTTATKGEKFTADSGTTAMTGDYISIDLDKPAGTPGVDLYVNIFYSPLNNSAL